MEQEEKKYEIDSKKLLIRKYVLALIKNNLSQIIQVFQSNSLEIKLNFFNKLKIFSDFRKLNKIRANIIFQKLLMSLNIFKKFFNKKQFFIKLKYFFLWRGNCILHTKLMNIKSGLENNLKKNYENNVKEIEENLKTKEQELINLKNKLGKQLETEEKLLKIISNFSANEKVLLTELQKVEEERKIIQEEITSFQNKCNDSYKLSQTLESNVKFIL
jgi:hypothetical protein